MTPSQAKAVDLAAVGLSALCLVHCLALPALALLLPVVGLWAQGEGVHLVFVLAAAPMALLAFIDLKARRPRDGRMAAVALCGLVLMATGACELLNGWLERPLTVAGGLLLAGAHIANWRRRGCAHPQ